MDRGAGATVEGVTLERTILACDVGTSSLKVALYTQAGRLIASSTRRYGFQSDRPGWAEGDPKEWWLALGGALADLAEQGHPLQRIEAMSFTGQMHSLVLLDSDGEVISPTILWLDRRAARETEDLRQWLSLPPYQLNSSFTLPKLLWLYRHRPDALARTRTILWPKDYLRFKLTGEACTDLTEPGGAVLLDWERKAYATERLALVGLDAEVLPPIRPASGSGGTIRPEVARSLGLSQDLKVVVGMGDVAALYAAAPPKLGRVICSMGSSSMIFAPLAEGQEVKDSAHRIHVYPFGPYPMVGGVSSTTGSSLLWAYENVCRGKDVGQSYSEALAQALEVAPGAEGLCFLPFLAGERNPFWSDTIRGGFYGLQLTHDHRHLLRAVMEGVAYSLRYLLDICEEAGVVIEEIALTGGGATTIGMPQMLADVSGLDVLIYAEKETVTRVLFALCQVHMGRGGFEEKLQETFDEPNSVVRPCQQLAGVYTEGYERYQAFAGFASAQADLAVKKEILTRR